MLPSECDFPYYQYHSLVLKLTRMSVAKSAYGYAEAEQRQADSKIECNVQVEKPMMTPLSAQ